ncbi:hypothetical protein QYE76_067269 [Lolium multiflorum]|uniref:Retrotransposon gag domain-containing protein n=1 Tax=Lolium multiflorum TaxID=4521 RepID=A0AAD8SCZ4_LOLMU|nr:hypothetical protein QYE76_067269 [Lolium multiflorum]
MHGERGVMMEDDYEEEEDDDMYPNYGDTATGHDENEEAGGGDQDEEASDEPVDDDLRRAIADAHRDAETENEKRKLKGMLDDHKKKLYPNCEDGNTKLGATLELLQWKAEAGICDKPFEKLLKIMKRRFPKDNELPDSTYEAKKVLCPLGLEVLKIHACINDCILYRAEYENLEKCPVCTALRYKIRRDDPGDVEGEPPRKRVPAKVMWYAPIIPRLKRLFRNKEHARLLRWHKEDRKKDEMLRHPADGSQWRKIDREFPDFADDARNLRLCTWGIVDFFQRGTPSERKAIISEVRQITGRSLNSYRRDDGGSRRGRREEPLWAQTTGGAAQAWPRHPCSGAHDPFRLLFFAYSFVPKPKPREDLTKGYSRLCGAENTREKRALRRAGIRRGNSLPEGEIDAIAIVIERDIISIIIIIISTIYTAITTAAPRHRCSNSGISMNEVRKKLFTISLSGKAAHWYKLLKNGDSIDWEDIVPLFYSKFYPPSEIHKDRNRIYNFWPHDGESIAQAWGRLKSLMLKCPIHELPGNVIIDNFYARLSFQDKTLLDTSCSGSFTRKNEEFKRDLLDRIQENTEGWENDKDRESVKDLVTENVEDGHIIFCEDASNIVSHPNKSKQVSVPMLSVRIGDHCYYGLCDIGASVSAIPYELYTEIMHEIGSCELEDIDVVIHLANRETISPIGIVRDVEVLCDRKGADNPVVDNLSRLENIAYDPVPVNDSFPNEQLAVIKVSSRESPCTMVSNNKDKEPLKENIQDPELKKEDAREDEEEVEEAPQERQQATVASIGVISSPSNIKRSARIATGGAVPRHYLAPRTSSPSHYNPYRNLIYDRQTERTPKVVLPSNWDINRSDTAGEKEPEAEEWGNNSKSWDSPSDRLLNRVEHNSEMIRNLIYRIDELQELIEKLVRNSSPSSPKE